MVTGDMISENSGSEHIIDDILLEIEAQSSAFLTEVLPREMFSKVVSDDIGFMRDMRSDKGSDILTWCRESIDSILDDMRVCTTPATMDSCTFSFTHEDDDGAIGGEGSDTDTRKASIDAVTVCECLSEILTRELMDRHSMRLRDWSEYLRMDILIMKIPIRKIR